jgi:hypothetical protein
MLLDRRKGPVLYSSSADLGSTHTIKSKASNGPQSKKVSVCKARQNFSKRLAQYESITSRHILDAPVEKEFKFTLSSRVALGTVSVFDKCAINGAI